MRVLLVDNSPAFGGSITGASVLLSGLGRAGFETAVLASRPDLFLPRLDPETKIFRIKWKGFRDVFQTFGNMSHSALHLWNSQVAYFHYSRRIKSELSNIIKEYEPDVLHVNNLNLHNRPFVTAARSLGIPVVLHVRMIRRFSRVEIQTAKMASRLVCSSQSLKRFMRVQHLIDLSQLTVVNHSVHTGASLDVNPDTVRQELKIPSGEPLVVVIGRFADWKGQHSAIGAWQKVLKAFPGATLAIAGNGNPRYQRRCQSLAKARGILPSVRFLGHRDDVPNLLAAADLVLIPYANDHTAHGPVEASGIAVIEAMSASRPIVATSLEVVQEILHGPSLNRKLSNPGDPDSMARRIIEALEDGSWRSQSGSIGRSIVEERHEVSLAADKMIKVYHDAMGRSRRVS